MIPIKRDFWSKAWVDFGVGSKGQNSTFSEHGHVAYQKGNHVCSNKQPGRKYFTRSPLPPFQKMIMLYIKLDGITNAASSMITNILPEPHPPDPGVGSKGQT